MPDQDVTWPVRVGLVPPLADCYIPRPETGHGLLSNLAPGDVVVLTPADDAATGGLVSPGGTGKTQLAVGLAHALWETHALDLLVWITASSRDAIVTGYAHALSEVGAGTAGEDPTTAATRFVDWLAASSQNWLVILDDLASAADLDGLWPQGDTGRVLVTTRRNDAALEDDARRVAPVGALTRREALSYLTAKFNNDPDQRIGALDLAEDLSCVPIGLAQAAAVMADRGSSCRDYRVRLAERRQHVTPAAADRCSSIVAITWSLCIDRADQLPPVGLAWPALVLATLLDPNGIPGSVLTSAAACDYITGDRAAAERAAASRAAGARASGDQAVGGAGGGAVGTAVASGAVASGAVAGRTVADRAVAENQVRAAVHNLARLGLVTIDPSSAARTVRVHALVQAAVRKYLSAAELDQAARADADALLQAWEAGDDEPLLAQALRDCAARLYDAAGDLLWTPEGHPLLFRAGASLDNVRLTAPAIAYWQVMADTSGRILGTGNAQTFRSRGSLANAYQNAGQVAEAIPLHERTLAEREWLLGAYHPDSLSSRGDLASSYRAAGRLSDAITLYERTVSDREGVLGADHPDTLASRGDLASAYRAAGRLDDAINLYRRALADRERIQGPDHPDTITARGNLAYAYRVAGRMKEAIPQYRRALADRERIQGPDHPDTITARGNLAYAYQTARRTKDAIPLYERTLADRERVQGPDHPDTITARGNLAFTYHTARRLSDALPLYERTLADCERVLGPDHPDTLTSRGNLGHAYHTAGRLTDAIKVFQRTLDDCERVLGVDDPLTQTVRENLEAAAQA